MPRYFFNVRRCDELIEDREGIELLGPDSIRDQCAKAIKETMAEEKWREATTDSEFQIVDELGRTVAIVPFRS